MRVIVSEEIIERMRKYLDNSGDSLLNSQVLAGIKINRWKRKEMSQLVKLNPPLRQRKAPSSGGFELVPAPRIERGTY